MWKRSQTPNDVLMHSAKGSSWKKHKYIAIKNGKYIYPTDTKTGDSKEVARKQALHKQAKNKGLSLEGQKAIEKAQEKARQANSTTRTNTINGTALNNVEDNSIWGPSGNKYNQERNARGRFWHFKNAEDMEKHYADNWRNYSEGSRGQANKSRRKAKGYKTAAKSAAIRADQWKKYIERTDRAELARWDNKKASEAGEYKQTLKKTSGNKAAANKNVRKKQAKNAVKTAAFKAGYKARKLGKAIKNKFKGSTTTYTYSSNLQPAGTKRTIKKKKK